jgi:Glycosyl hydrolases family 16
LTNVDRRQSILKNEEETNERFLLFSFYKSLFDFSKLLFLFFINMCNIPFFSLPFLFDYSIDVRHMPAGCGVWPAFWLTDEANWPVNGEIDIVEGVNYQNVAKTALHSTKGCSMYDIPLGTMTGGWDTAQGIPDAKTGIPDMTLRYAQNCFVYDPHQWLNQGCVAVNQHNDTLGQPLNDNNGGVFALGTIYKNPEPKKNKTILH